MTIYTPETGTRTTSVETTVTGILNPLPVGTRIRATLGENVIVGRVTGQATRFPIVYVNAEGKPGKRSSCFLEFGLWASSGWVFEVLNGEVSA